MSYLSTGEDLNNMFLTDFSADDLKKCILILITLGDPPLSRSLASCAQSMPLLLEHLKLVFIAQIWVSDLSVVRNSWSPIPPLQTAKCAKIKIDDLGKKI